MFPFLTVFIIFLLVTYLRREQLRNKQKKREEAFWAREEEANMAPPKDLSQIEYVKIPLELLPIGQVDDEDLAIIEDELLELSEKPILNLDGKTNTDVKLEYGAANFGAISDMGENFDRLIMLLCDYAKALIEGGHENEALPVLEYGAGIGSDISANYVLLGECYRSLGMEEELEKLKEMVEASGLPLKERILSELNEEEDGEDKEDANEDQVDKDEK